MTNKKEIENQEIYFDGTKEQQNKYDKTPNYYKFEIDGKTFDVNDITKTWSKRLKNDYIDLFVFGKCMEILQYLLRSFDKESFEKDFEKIKHNCEIILEYIKNDK